MFNENAYWRDRGASPLAHGRRVLQSVCLGSIVGRSVARFPDDKVAMLSRDDIVGLDRCVYAVGFTGFDSILVWLIFDHS